MSLRQQWSIANPFDITEEKDIKAIVGQFGKDAKRFKSNIDSRNFGEEVFEFDMQQQNIKKFEKGWTWEDFNGSVGSYQRFGLDPFEYHIPNAVAFTHDVNFYKPDYTVLYWKETENGLQLVNKLVEVKGTRNIKNQDFHLYCEYQKNIIDPHNEKVDLFVKDLLIPKCLLEFEIFIYPTAYASGINDPNWNPSTHHTQRLEIFTVDELIEAWNETPRDPEDPKMQLDTSSVFDPQKVLDLKGIEWTDEHYKKKIFKKLR